MQMGNHIFFGLDSPAATFVSLRNLASAAETMQCGVWEEVENALTAAVKATPSYSILGRYLIPWNFTI